MSIQTHHFSSSAGPWLLHLFEPSSPIPGIQALWAVEAQTRQFREKVLPRPTVEWMINLSPGPHHILHRNGTPKSTHREAWLSGLQRECLFIESPQPPCFIAASIHPAFAADFAGQCPSQFTESVLELPPLSIYGRLRQAESWPERFDLFQAFLHTLQPQPNPAIVVAVNRILASEGAAPILSIAKELRISHKHLIDLCRKTTGLSPKRLARLVRLHHAITQSRAEAVNWTAVAHDCGFHDQAHFNREFKRFTGVTPTEFLNTREASGQAMLEE
jgi:AraC-like DNA-binding protein